MLKLENAIAAAICALALSACGGPDAAAAENAAVATDTNGMENDLTEQPADPAANGSSDPVPPPDAVSHPDGFLPPAPADPNASDTPSTGPATEDEYLRNGQ